MDGCSKERVFCSCWAPKSSKHTFFETGPQKWTAVSMNVNFVVVERQKAQNTRSLKQGPRKFRRFIRSFVRSSFRSCIWSFIRSLVKSFIRSLQGANGRLFQRTCVLQFLGAKKLKAHVL